MRYPPPQAICFDAYDTLVTLADPPARLQAQLAAAGVEVELATARAAFLAEAGWYRDHSLEGHDADSLAALRRHCATILGQRIAEDTPHDLGPDALVDILLASLDFRLTPGCQECLDALAARQIQMAVVSNWDCSLLEIMDHLGLSHYFRTIVVSAIIGHEKPAPETWQPALTALGVPPEAIWHVGDDLEADGFGARGAGLWPVLVGGATNPDMLSIGSLAELPTLLADAGS